MVNRQSNGKRYFIVTFDVAGRTNTVGEVNLKRQLYLLDKLHNENMKTRELNWDREQGKHTGRGTVGTQLGPNSSS